MHKQKSANLWSTCIFISETSLATFILVGITQGELSIRLWDIRRCKYSMHSKTTYSRREECVDIDFSTVNIYRHSKESKCTHISYAGPLGFLCRNRRSKTLYLVQRAEKDGFFLKSTPLLIQEVSNLLLLCWLMPHPHWESVTTTSETTQKAVGICRNGWFECWCPYSVPFACDWLWSSHGRYCEMNGEEERSQISKLLLVLLGWVEWTPVSV